MVKVDISIPESCAECLMSCRMWDNTVLCRNDFKKHIPLDEGCPIKGEINATETE